MTVPVGTLEIAIQLGNFKNVDLRSQGLYRIAVSLHSAEVVQKASDVDTHCFHKENVQPNAVGTGIPYATFSQNKRTTSSQKVPVALTPPTFIDEHQVRWYSSTFAVTYQNQTIALNDGCLFRVEVPLDVFNEENHNDGDSGVPQMECALCMVVRLERCILEETELGRVFVPEDEHFEQVAAHQMLLQNPHKGLHTFADVVLDDTFVSGFSCTELMVHSAIVGLNDPGRLNGHSGISRCWGKVLSATCDVSLPTEQIVEQYSRVRTKLLSPFIQSYRALGSFLVDAEEIARPDVKVFPSGDDSLTHYTRLDASFLDKIRILCIDTAAPTAPTTIDTDQIPRSTLCDTSRSDNKLAESGSSKSKLGKRTVTTETEFRSTPQTKDACSTVLGESIESARSTRIESKQGKERSEKPTKQVHKSVLAASKIEQLASWLDDDVSSIAGMVLLLWHDCVNIYTKVGPEWGRSCERSKWLTGLKDLVSRRVVVETQVEAPQHTSSAQIKRKLDVANSIRKFACSSTFQHVNTAQLLDSNVVIEPQSQPVLFEQRVVSSTVCAKVGATTIDSRSINVDIVETNVKKTISLMSLLKRSSPLRRNRHLVVFVHGFKGSPWDLRVLRNLLSVLHPDVDTLLSNSNAQPGQTSNSIDEMGRRLATEVTTVVNAKFGTTTSSLTRISFVAHSIGALIVRSALNEPCMAKLLPVLHTLMSLSSPHLGTRLGGSPLVAAGMWFLKRWGKVKSLEQLAMTDADTAEDTFLWKLSMNNSLSHFKHVILASSRQDLYVPHYSARLELPRTIFDQGFLDVLRRMRNNVLAGLDPEKIRWVDLDFEFNPQYGRTVDKILGRSAHIHYLESSALSMMLLVQFHSLFSCESLD